MGETILVAEDEAPVLKIVRTTLERQGYTVLAADDPAEVCRLAERHDGHIHLLLTDVIMPGMSGMVVCGVIVLGRLRHGSIQFQSLHS